MSLSAEWVTKVQNGNFNSRYFIVRHGESEANVMKLVSSIYSVSVANHGLTERGAQQAKNAAQVFADIAKEPIATEDILGSKISASKQQQKEEGSDEILYNPLNLDNVIFYVSDFKRAYETGHYLKEVLITQNDQAITEHEKQQKVTPEGLQLHTPAFIPTEAATKPPQPTNTESTITPKKTNFVPFYSTPALRERFFGVFEGACPSDDIYDQVWDQDNTKEPDSTHFNVESIQSVVTRTTELILELEQIWKDKIIILVSHGDVAQIVLAVCASIDPRFHRSLPHMKNCDVRELLFVDGRSSSDQDPEAQ